MGLSIGVLKETLAGERRVAITPKVIDVLTKAGAEVLVESGAGLESCYPDEDYTAKGAKIAPNAAAVAEAAQILLTVRVPAPGGLVKNGQIVIGMADPLSDPQLSGQYAQAGATLFSLELVPRITRAQSMDVLSSMASIAGYKAVLLAASALPRLFPMMSTAAGTVPPARVLVLGAGVAGLQAIATARRLGAVVSGYDVRAAVKEQIESLGAKFVSITLGASGEGQGGYARALTEEDSQPTRANVGGSQGARRGDHHGRRPGAKSSDSCYARHGLRHESRLGYCRSGCGARWQLRAYLRRRKHRQPWRHHHRTG